ncbi:MAG TPA: glycosyltransferase family 4 protein [Gemmatimonadaceae bacterium]|nr:glycosyltransferase family 4 protein [Vicinamibacterales bacterium]
MKVLIANTDCRLGGVGTFMLSLRAALRAAGHHAELFYLQHGPLEAQLAGDPHVHFGSLTDLLRLVDREAFDIVHANNIDWASGMSAVPRIGARLVLTAHKLRAPAWTYGWTTRDCQAFVAVSRWVRDGLQPYTDIPIQVVPNGIDVHRFSPGPAAPNGSGPIVAWVGRGGSRVKRLEFFAQLAPALRRAGCRIWVVDQHPPTALAEDFPDAAQLLHEHADRWGGVDHLEMPRLYREIAASGGCVISTSSQEGLGLALLEAQSCGCPVIGPDVNGVNESVSPEHGGLLFPSDASPDAAAALVIETLRDRDALQRRGAAAAAHVRNTFSLECMARSYLQIYGRRDFGRVGTLRSRMRARRRLTPVFHTPEYLEHRWGVGDRQLEVARELARSRDWRLAAAAARASIRAAPTLYLKPGRLLTLVGLELRARTAPRTRRTPPDSGVAEDRRASVLRF